MSAALLRPIHQETKWRVVKLVENWQVGASRVAEDNVYTALYERLVHKLPASHPREAKVFLVNIFIAILQDNYTDVHDTISE